MGMVSSGPLAGSVLDLLEICVFLGSPEVTLVHQQKKHDAVLPEEASCRLRNVTGVLLYLYGANTDNSEVTARV